MGWVMNEVDNQNLSNQVLKQLLFSLGINYARVYWKCSFNFLVCAPNSFVGPFKFNPFSKYFHVPFFLFSMYM